MVAKGSGKIVLDVELADNYAFHVKVGDAEPVEVSCDSRQEKEVPYTVEENTYVYIYLVQKAGAVRAGTRIGRRATAHGKIYSSKCVGSGSSFVMGDADGNGKVDYNIYKRINGKYTLIGTVASGEMSGDQGYFVDGNVSAGNSYKYYVAVVLDGETEASLSKIKTLKY